MDFFAINDFCLRAQHLVVGAFDYLFGSLVQADICQHGVRCKTAIGKQQGDDNSFKQISHGQSKLSEHKMFIQRNFVQRNHSAIRNILTHHPELTLNL
jgi:hypothetical protein